MQTSKRRLEANADESILAMFLEGGGLATTVCVPAAQNSRTQGPIMSRVQDLCDLKMGDKVLLRIVGGCSQYNFTQPPTNGGGRNKITDAHETVKDAISNSSTTLLDPFQDGSLTYVGVPLGELEAGRYQLDISMSSELVTRAEVLNQYGDSYAM
jgi:hypothetical protein